MWRLWSPFSRILLFYLFALSSCRIVERAHSRTGARQDFHNELLRLEALALTRLPWNVNAVHGREVIVVGEANRTAHGLKKRADGPEPDQGDMVLSLWKNAPSKVPVNNMFVKYDITPDKSVVMTTSTCYGCTAVVMCSGPGKICIFAHFRQSNSEDDTWAPGPKRDVDFATNVMDPIEAALSEYKDQLSPSPFCVIFTPATAPPTSVFYYPARIKGEDSINDAITQAFTEASILNIGYNYMGAKGDYDDNKAFGKLVLEWKGSASSCAAGGSSVLNVFAEDNWWRSLRFDDSGNQVTIQNTPCQSPAGSEDGFDAEIPELTSTPS